MLTSKGQPRREDLLKVRSFADSERERAERSRKWGESARRTRVLQLAQTHTMLPVVDLDIYRESKDASRVAAEARKVGYRASLDSSSTTGVDALSHPYRRPRR